MSHEDYMRGFSGQTTIPQNHDEQKGIIDRQWNEEQQRKSERLHTGIPAPDTTWSAPASYAGTGGGGGLVLLFLFLGGPLVFALIGLISALGYLGGPLAAALMRSLPALAFIAGGAFLASFVAGLILVALTPLLTRGHVAYRKARRASFAGLCGYLVVTVPITFLVMFLQSPSVPSRQLGPMLEWLWNLTLTRTSPFSMAGDVSTLAATPIDTWPAIIGVLFVTRAPGLIWFTHVLRKRMHDAFAGGRGLFAAGLLALIGVEGALSVGLWASRVLAARSQAMPLTGDERLPILVAYCGLVLLPCAVVGALVAGPVLRAMTPRVRKRFTRSRLDTYLAALRALLAFGALSILAVVLFRGADPLVWRLAEVVLEGRPAPAFAPSAVRDAVLAALAFALPGLLWAASIIAASWDNADDDDRDYPKAIGIAAVTCAAGLLPSWALALGALSSVLRQ